MKGSSYSQLRAKLWLLRNVNPLLEWSSRTLAPAASLQGREVIFQGIVHRALDRLGIDVAFYPLRSAANYSYFYLLVRIVEELPVKRILELGCGQSTLLLDQLAKHKPVACMSFEHDPGWLDRIGKQLEHVELVHSPLVRRTILGHLTCAYDTSPIANQGKFDVLLVDGPQGQRRRSRWGALEIIENWLADDFVIVFDDAERRGEQQTIARALQLLDALGRRYHAVQIRSICSQFVIAGGRLGTARYF